MNRTKQAFLEEIGVPPSEMDRWSGPYWYTSMMFEVEGPKDMLVFCASESRYAVKDKNGQIEEGHIKEIKTTSRQGVKEVRIVEEGEDFKRFFQIEGDQYSLWMDPPEEER